MTTGRGTALAMAMAMTLAAASAGCGIGAGPSSKGEATLTVTRDYGSVGILAADERDPTASETVLRFLDREADITARYGGGFVQSIEGLAGAEHDGRAFDWFFYVNGAESPVGAAEVHVHGGDRIWWDYRDWTDAMSVPAVVGSWPEPFSQASAGVEHDPVEIECVGARPPCKTVADGLAEAGVDAGLERPRAQHGNGPAASALRLLVGPWASVRADPAARQIEDGPDTSGVFADFTPGRGSGDPPYELDALDERAEPVDRLGAGAGLVAAVRQGDRPVTWVVTGADPRGVQAAAGLLDTADLRNHYAIAVDGDRTIPLPVVEGPGA
jgi:hypothetical protein